MAQQDRPDIDEQQELLRIGFTRAQVSHLLDIRSEQKARRELERIPEVRRQEFIRWLYQRGRLQS